VDRDQDLKCIEKILDGDRNAYAFLVDRYKDMAYSLALRMVRNREEAEEIAQDAFVKAFRSLSSFKGNSRFSTWLYKIVYNTSISSLRKKEIEKLDLDEASLPAADITESSSAYASLNNAERSKFLEKALEVLDEDERFLIIMYYYEELDIDELAAITSLTKTNTKVRLFRSRKKMLAYLELYLKEETYNLI
jgi:RNA polymerase sigma factor (sigma-70 family)